jgi:hypothetical protein
LRKANDPNLIPPELYEFSTEEKYEIGILDAKNKLTKK